MNKTILAVVFQEGGKLLSEIIRIRPLRKLNKTRQPAIEEVQREIELVEQSKKAQDIATGCVPCSIGHLGTCVGVLNEAMRFARDDSIESKEVIDRVSICIDELNALERVDLRSELIVQLPPWEKELAVKALTESRTLRHSLEGISSIEQLEKVAANTQHARNEIGRGWFRERLARMPKEEKAKLAEKAIEKLGKEG